jgi:opacity protein-like surface antigen
LRQRLHGIFARGLGIPIAQCACEIAGFASCRWNPTIGTIAFSDRITRLGGALGVGLEHKFSPNWSGKIEYLYLDFGTRTFLSGTGFATDIRRRDNIVRVGLNYAFDSAVVAKY